MGKTPQVLSDSGYETSLIGLHHEAYDDSREACSLSFQHEKNLKLKIMMKSREKTNQKANQTSPFFALISFFETHRINDNFDKYDGIKCSMWSSPHICTIRRMLGMISLIFMVL